MEKQFLEEKKDYPVNPNEGDEKMDSFKFITQYTEKIDQFKVFIKYLFREASLSSINITKIKLNYSVLYIFYEFVRRILKVPFY